MQLVRYEQARRALAECQRVDEVKDLRDKASAMAAYARQAQDTTMVLMAQEIKVRAERRAGEMLRQLSDAGDRHTGRNDSRVESHDATPRPTLDDIGITKDQSSRWQSIAAIPSEIFESVISDAKATEENLTSAVFLRIAKDLRKADASTSSPTIRERKELASAEQTDFLAKSASTPPTPSSRVQADEDSSGDKSVRVPLTDQQEDYGPSAEETALLDELDEANQRAFESVVALADEDDKLAGALRIIADREEEIARLTAELCVVKEARDGFMSSRNEAIQMVKSLQRKLAQAERKAA